MKKILSVSLAIMMLGTTAFAQNTVKQPKKMTVKTTATPDKTISATPSVKHLKKDGTPDMRYKENKMAKSAKAPAKMK